MELRRRLPARELPTTNATTPAEKERVPRMSNRCNEKLVGLASNFFLPLRHRMNALSQTLDRATKTPLQSFLKVMRPTCVFIEHVMNETSVPTLRSLRNHAAVSAVAMIPILCLNQFNNLNPARDQISRGVVDLNLGMALGLQLCSSIIYVLGTTTATVISLHLRNRKFKELS